ncbi:hypothetical protein [Nocardioides sp. SYSU DS0651]|uniref:hypothetical protein n=1 Tax=Nocardioides sp. SYSU DS0651 TaxID=3415955 RepID=UPI003F4C2FA7
MPSVLARLHLTAARLVDGRTSAPHVVSHQVVPVTVRALTADAADLRLLLEVRVEDGTLDPHLAERFVHAVAVPATRRWIERHDLASLQTRLTPVLSEVGGTIEDPLAELGLTLLDVVLVAAEHVLTPASTDPVDGPE